MIYILVYIYFLIYSNLLFWLPSGCVLMLSVLPPGKARSGKLQVRRPSNSISYHSMLQALLLYVFSIYIFIVLDIINIYFFSGECWRFFLCLWTFLHTCRRVGFFCCACVICLPIARCPTLLCSVAQHCLHVGARLNTKTHG